MNPSEALTLLFAAPPFLNDAYKCWRNRVVLTQAGKDYKHTVWVQARQQIRAAQQIWPLGSGYPVFKKGEDVAVWVTWYRTARRGDTDGILKLLLDSLQGTVYHKDSQVAALTVVRVDPGTDVNLPGAFAALRPCVAVTVAPFVGHVERFTYVAFRERYERD